MDPSIRRQLARIDWDFPSSKISAPLPPHWYPGTFTPPLATTLVAALSSPGDLVFDPFAGIGTTGAAAIRQGRRAWLVEHNPIGMLSSYVWAGALCLYGRDRRLWSELMQNLSFHIDQISPDRARPLFSEPLPGCPSKFLAESLRPTPLALWDQIAERQLGQAGLLEGWIHRRTLAGIRSAIKETQSADDPFVRLCLLVMLSGILRSSSSQTRSWGHIADNVLPKTLLEKDLGGLLRRWLTRFRQAVNGDSDPKEIPDGPVAFISHHDWTQNNEVGLCPLIEPQLLLTSPPYGDAIDYVLAQRLSLYLLGYDADEISVLSRSEIGARRRRFASASRSVWADELEVAFARILSFSSGESTAALVMPAQDSSRKIGNQKLEETFIANEWILTFRGERSIRKARARQSWTSISREELLVFEKKLEDEQE